MERNKIWGHHGLSIAKCLPKMVPVQITACQTQCESYVTLKESPTVIHILKYSYMES